MLEEKYVSKQKLWMFWPNIVTLAATTMLFKIPYIPPSIVLPTEVFTIITTKDQQKDQSGGIIIAQVGRDLCMAVVNKPHPRATPSDSVCLLP